MLPLDAFTVPVCIDWFERLKELYKEQEKDLDGVKVQNLIYSKFKKDEDLWRYQEMMRILIMWEPEFFKDVAQS